MDERPWLLPVEVVRSPRGASGHLAASAAATESRSSPIHKQFWGDFTCDAVFIAKSFHLYPELELICVSWAQWFNYETLWLFRALAFLHVLKKDAFEFFAKVLCGKK
jgi:hypothetical protein